MAEMDVWCGDTKHVVMFDDDDWPIVRAHRWRVRKASPSHPTYAETSIDGRSVGMHRVFLDSPKGMVVDHINGNGLDNRRDNLRVATTQQNNQNRGHTKSRGGRPKGVYAHKTNGRFYAHIKVHGKLQRLGGYATEEEAARAYDRAAREHHGEFARLNFPDEHGDG